MSPSHTVTATCIFRSNNANNLNNNSYKFPVYEHVFQPRDEDSPLCGSDQLSCFQESVKIVEESAFAGAESAVTDCHCLPSCTDYEYPAQSSYSKITTAGMLHLPARITEKNDQFANSSFVTNNVAVLHVYFR